MPQFSEIYYMVDALVNAKKLLSNLRYVTVGDYVQSTDITSVLDVASAIITYIPYALVFLEDMGAKPPSRLYSLYSKAQNLLLQIARPQAGDIVESSQWSKVTELLATLSQILDMIMSAMPSLLQPEPVIIAEYYEDLRLWNMFHHDPQHTGKTTAVDVIYVGSNDTYLYALDLNGTLKWRYKTGGAIHGNPVVARDGTVYFGSADYYVYALNQDGTLRWMFATGGMVLASAAVGYDGTVYIGSLDYYLYALNPDGTLKWRLNLGDYVLASVLLTPFNTLFTGPITGGLYAVKTDGTILWKYSGVDIYSVTPSMAHAEIIYFAGTVSATTYLHAVTKDGRLLWKYNIVFDTTSSPMVGGDGTIYVGGESGYLYAINPNGTLKWKYDATVPIMTTPAITSQAAIVFGANHMTPLQIENPPPGYVYALNPDGTLQWRYQTSAPVESSPAVAGDDTIIAGCDDHYIYALNPDGTLKWRFQTGDIVYSSPAVVYT